jgi:hypothetical protein
MSRLTVIREAHGPWTLNLKDEILLSIAGKVLRPIFATKQEAVAYRNKLKRCPRCGGWSTRLEAHRGSLNCHLRTQMRRIPNDWRPVCGAKNARAVRRSRIPQKWNVASIDPGFGQTGGGPSRSTRAKFTLYVPLWVHEVLMWDLGHLLAGCKGGPSAAVEAARTMRALGGQKEDELCII